MRRARGTGCCSRRARRNPMQHEVHRQASTRHRATPRAATVRYAAQQARLNANAEGIHAEHANGPGAGAALHGSHRTIEPGESAPRRVLLSYPRVLRASACICVKPCLLRREPLDAAGSEGTHLAACRQVTHAPIEASARACSVAAEPHAPEAIARAVLLTVSPRSAHETMARLVRDRSGCYFI